MAEKFPIRLSWPLTKMVITLPRNCGTDSKIYLRNEAKKMSKYHLPIECEISGRDNNGREIPIDNVGKWLFGTPGYMGHIRIRIFEDSSQIWVEYPQNSPTVVHEFLGELKQKVEARSK